MFQRLLLLTYSCLFHALCFPHGLLLYAIATSYFLSDAAAAVVLLCGVRAFWLCHVASCLGRCCRVNQFVILLALLLRWLTHRASRLTIGSCQAARCHFCPATCIEALR